MSVEALRELDQKSNALPHMLFLHRMSIPKPFSLFPWVLHVNLWNAGLTLDLRVLRAADEIWPLVAVNHQLTVRDLSLRPGQHVVS